MRALAHPVRLDILDAMRNEGQLTATRAAELLGQTAGNMSWHLQTLAKYGYIVEAEGAKGRSRPWKIAPGTTRVNSDDAVPGSDDAVEQLVTMMLDRSFDQLLDWWHRRKEYNQAWSDSTFITEVTSFMTPAELAELGKQVAELLRRYDDRTDDPGQRPADALPVHIVAWAHPLPRIKPHD